MVVRPTVESEKRAQSLEIIFVCFVLAPAIPTVFYGLVIIPFVEFVLGIFVVIAGIELAPWAIWIWWLFWLVWFF